jgi:hypothetical protein
MFFVEIYWEECLCSYNNLCEKRLMRNEKSIKNLFEGPKFRWDDIINRIPIFTDSGDHGV